MTYQKGSAQALANPAKSKTKIQESLTQYYQKNVSVKRLIRVKSVQSVFHFFDLWPCRRLGTQQRHHGINISVRIMCPSAYGDGQKFKHGLHGEHGFDFFTDFFSWQMVIGFIFGFS